MAEKKEGTEGTASEWWMDYLQKAAASLSATALSAIKFDCPRCNTNLRDDPQFLSRHRSAETQCWERRYVRTYVRTYVVRIVCNAHARVMEAENSITLTIYNSEHVFIALRWRSEMIMGFHEYTYQDREYIIRAMNTKHAQCTCLYFSW